MHSPTKKSAPVVFISYAHEKNLKAKIKELSDWLTDKGVQVITDLPYKDRPPEKGWQIWMLHSIEDADFVLVVCTERYKDLFEKREREEEGGFGVTYEGAIITNDLYYSQLKNNRYYPILPDDGDHSHIPVTLQAWNNNHRFPSGNDRILSLIREPIRIPSPKMLFQQALPSELLASSDPRIQPREGEIIGREKEVQEVLDFLHGAEPSASVCCNVTASAGIGKTEVCKAALKQWLDSGDAPRVFFISVPDNADAQRLLGQIGEAVDLSPETIAQISTVTQLRHYLPHGLYYLDNLESVAESSGGIQMLREFSQVPGIRLLASSRVSLDGVLGSSIPIYRLDTESATQLFLKCWGGQTPPDRDEVRMFVDQQLGGHALSITLLARLGRSYSLSAIKKLWCEQGTFMASTRRPQNRIDSLDISFSLTAKLLAHDPGALDLWQFAALFHDGFEEKVLELWEKVSGHSKSRITMTDHNLISIDRQIVKMLPPVARYAFRYITSGEDANYFNWENARDYAYKFFIELSTHAANIASNYENIQSRIETAKKLRAIEQLFKMDIAFGSPNINLAQKLHQQLINVYQFNIVAGHGALQQINQMLADGLSEIILGDLESRLGNVDLAREHYDEAIELYKKEQEPMGLAYTLSELIRCNKASGCLPQNELTRLVVEALEYAGRSGVESVQDYVKLAVFEYFDKDEKKFADFLESLTEGNEDV